MDRNERDAQRAEMVREIEEYRTTSTDADKEERLEVQEELLALWDQVSSMADDKEARDERWDDLLGQFAAVSPQGPKS